MKTDQVLLLLSVAAAIVVRISEAQSSRCQKTGPFVLWPVPYIVPTPANTINFPPLELTCDSTGRVDGVTQIIINQVVTGTNPRLIGKKTLPAGTFQYGDVPNLQLRAQMSGTGGQFKFTFSSPQEVDLKSYYQCVIWYVDSGDGSTKTLTCTVELTAVPDPRPVNIEVTSALGPNGPYTASTLVNLTCQASLRLAWGFFEGNITLEYQMAVSGWKKFPVVRKGRSVTESERMRGTTWMQFTLSDIGDVENCGLFLRCYVANQGKVFLEHQAAKTVIKVPGTAGGNTRCSENANFDKYNVDDTVNQPGSENEKKDTSSNEKASPKNERLSDSVIAGIAIGSAAGAAFLAVLVVMIYRQQQRRPRGGLKRLSIAAVPSPRVSIIASGQHRGSRGSVGTVGMMQVPRIVYADASGSFADPYSYSSYASESSGHSSRY